MNKVVIHFANDPQDRRSAHKASHKFPSFQQASEFCRNNISYSGGRVKRVEIHDGDSAFAMWDSSWDAVSQAAGLRKTP